MDGCFIALKCLCADTEIQEKWFENKEGNREKEVSGHVVKEKALSAAMPNLLLAIGQLVQLLAETSSGLLGAQHFFLKKEKF